MKKTMAALMAMGLFAGGVNAQELINAQNKNGSFETGNKGWGIYASKKVFSSKESKTVEATETLPAADGNKYLQLTGVVTGKKGALQLQTKIKENITLTAGSKLEASCKVRIQSKDAKQVRIALVGYEQSGGKTTLISAKANLKKTNEWISISKSVDIDKALELKQIELRLQFITAGVTSGATVEVHVDDVKLAVKTETAPATE